MPPRRLALAAALMTILLTPGAADAGKRGQSGGGDRPGPISPSLWLVELESPPAVEGTDAATLEREHRDFERAAARAGLGYRRRGDFRTLFNGFSVAIDPRDLGTLARLPGVRLYPAEPVPPAIANAVSMTGVDEVQTSLGLTGAGIKIGIIDSGIDYDHPDLGGCFGPGCKVAYGYDFVGDAYNASADTEPVPDDDPDDCGGHGTHVAGIAAADGEIVGVAPGATLGAYRVFGCSGTTSDDVIIAALERALADGMDVVNLSLGAPFAWAKGPVGMAASRLVNAGVVVVAAQGNDGASGLYTTGTVAAGEKVIGVGSVENAVLPFSGIEVAGHTIAVNNNQTGPPLPTSGSETIVAVGGDPCNNAFGKDPAGKVALTPFPGAACDTGVVVSNLSNAGASGILLYWPTADFLVSFNIPWLTIPAGSIRRSEAEFIGAQADPVAMTWLGAIANPAAGRVAGSSSWGLEPELRLKPNLSAPGVGIVSTYPLEKGGHATLSGTSMASPHVAGAAALLLEAYPRTPAQAVRGVLQASAVPVAKPPVDPALAGLDWPLAQQGAGLLQIDAAIGAGARIEPAELSLGEGACGETTRATLRVESRSPDDRVYDLSASSALATTGVVSVGLAASDESVAFSVGGTPTTTLALPAGGTAEVDVTFTRDCATEGSHGIYGGWVVLDEPVFEEELVVPYVGFAGDYQAIDVWPAGWEPQLRGGGASFGCSFTTVFDLSTCRPVFVVHLRHEVRRLRFEVESVSGRAWHRAFPDFEYMPRNRDAAPNSLSNYYGFWWDGVTSHGKKQTELPDGDYLVRVSVLKALGDDANPDDWESAVVGPFTIDRP